jgi:hypothetical protein
MNVVVVHDLDPHNRAPKVAQFIKDIEHVSLETLLEKAAPDFFDFTQSELCSIVAAFNKTQPTFDAIRNVDTGLQLFGTVSLNMHRAPLILVYALLLPAKPSGTFMLSPPMTNLDKFLCTFGKGQQLIGIASEIKQEQIQLSGGTDIHSRLRRAEIRRTSAHSHEERVGAIAQSLCELSTTSKTSLYEDLIPEMASLTREDVSEITDRLREMHGNVTAMDCESGASLHACLKTQNAQKWEAVAQVLLSPSMISRVPHLAQWCRDQGIYF